MSDDHKTFKSKKMELFGKGYLAKHKSLTSLNNRYFIIFGFIKYHYFKFYNRKFIPLMNSYGFLNISDFCIFLFICSVFYFCVAFFFVMITADIEHNKQIDSCIENACSIIDKYCKNTEKVILRYCIMNHISILPIIKTQYLSYNEWIVYIIIRLILGIFILNLVLKFLCYLYDIIYFRVTKFNNQIPEMEEI